MKRIFKLFKKHITDFFIYHYWWICKFKKVKVVNIVRPDDCYSPGRCVLCDAGNYINIETGNKEILCGPNKKCPCNYDTCLKLKNKK